MLREEQSPTVPNHVPVQSIWPRRPAASSVPGSARLAPFDVLDVAYLWLAWVYPDIGKHWHQVLAERIKLPCESHLANAKVGICAEADVVIHPLRGPVTGLLQATLHLVVLLGRHRPWGEVDNEAHSIPPQLGVGPTLSDYSRSPAASRSHCRGL